jgi:hypothetical protein
MHPLAQEREQARNELRVVDLYPHVAARRTPRPRPLIMIRISALR